LGWDDILESKKRNCTWGGKTYAVPNDGDQHFVGFRKDIFEDSTNQDKFKKKYGYDLPVNGPETWDQFRDLAEFFNNWDWDKDGKPEYGTAQTCTGWLTNYWLLDYGAAYIVKGGEPPSDTNTLYFDTKTMEPLLKTPAFVKALEFNLEIVTKFSPPGQIGWGQAEQRDAWSHGDIAMILDWPDMRMYVNDPKRSVIQGKVGYCMLPGSKQFYDRQAGKWITLDKVNRVGLFCFGGWVMSISKTCKNPDAAFDFLRWITSPKNSVDEIMDPNTGWDPYRYSHFDYQKYKDKWAAAGAIDAEAALAALQDGMKHGFITNSIPGAFDYMQTLSVDLGKAYAKELTVKDALNQAYEDWNKITDSKGRDKQLALYRKSLGLPPI